MTYDRLLLEIQKMTPEQRAKQVSCFDENGDAARMVSILLFVDYLRQTNADEDIVASVDPDQFVMMDANWDDNRSQTLEPNQDR